MAKSYQTARGTNRYAASHFDVTVIDCLPALSGPGDPKIINSHALSGRLAVVYS